MNKLTFDFSGLCIACIVQALLCRAIYIGFYSDSNSLKYHYHRILYSVRSHKKNETGLSESTVETLILHADPTKQMNQQPKRIVVAEIPQLINTMIPDLG